MIRSLAMVAAASLGMMIAAPALTTPAQAQDIPQGVFFMKQKPTQFLARDLVLGAKIYGPNNKIIGDVEDLVLNDDNQIVGVIMGVGGFLGVGEKRIGVRYRALSFETQDGKVKVSLPEATQAVLKKLPAYERSAPKKSLLDRAIEKARELRDKTGQTSSDAYKKAKETAGPAIQKATDAAKQAYDKAKETTGQVVDKAREAAGGSTTTQ
ncbi:MAG: PRC-barrel domain-containing protein [Pseudomonadota bacterium]